MFPLINVHSSVPKFDADLRILKLYLFSRFADQVSRTSRHCFRIFITEAYRYDEYRYSYRVVAGGGTRSTSKGPLGTRTSTCSEPSDWSTTWSRTGLRAAGRTTMARNIAGAQDKGDYFRMMNDVLQKQTAAHKDQNFKFIRRFTQRRVPIKLTGPDRLRGVLNEGHSSPLII
eukprot:scaffold47791_cov18-Prasinocladus_malaysianus.AAC.2